MLEKPRLEDEQICACLRSHYGISVSELEFLPLGYDSAAGVYRVHGGGQTYFLKVKRDGVDEVSVRLARYLKDQGIEQVVAPLPTVTQELWAKIDEFTLILYPFIDGKTGMDAGLSADQWIAFGAALKKVHTTPLSPDLLKRMPRETFVPQPHWAGIVKRLQASIASQRYKSPAEKQLAAFWKDQRQLIDRLVAHAEQLGRRLQTQPSDLVVCHADIHTNNLLIHPQGKLFIVDWDQPVLAPRERDLMFVTVGTFVTDPREEALFFQGYGKTEVDPLKLAYYRYARAVEDMGGFAESVFFMEVGDETKQDSAAWFIRVVEAARAMDDVSPL